MSNWYATVILRLEKEKGAIETEAVARRWNRRHQLPASAGEDVAPAETSGMGRRWKEGLLARK